MFDVRHLGIALIARFSSAGSLYQFLTGSFLEFDASQSDVRFTRRGNHFWPSRRPCEAVRGLSQAGLGESEQARLTSATERFELMPLSSSSGHSSISTHNPDAAKRPRDIGTIAC
jgi:hypothetical protein